MWLGCKAGRVLSFIRKWQRVLFESSSQTLCVKSFSPGIEQHYSHSNCSFDKGGFPLSSGLIFLPLSLVHTGFPLVPHGSNDPLIILYSDALIKLMCWFYVFNLPWSPHNPLCSPAVPLSHSSEDPRPLWSQSPVKGLKRLNSWRIVGASVVYVKAFPHAPCPNSPLLNEVPTLPASHPCAAFKFPRLGAAAVSPRFCLLHLCQAHLPNTKKTQ